MLKEESVKEKIMKKILPFTWYYRYQMRSIDRYYKEKLQNETREDEIHLLQDFKWDEEGRLDDEMKMRTSDHWINKANKMYAPIPEKPNGDMNEYWHRLYYKKTYCLTDEGIKQVRRNIRDEIVQRWELRKMRFSWINALPGIIGALTGLMAVILTVL